MQDNKLTMSQIGGGNFKTKKLIHSRNVLIQGRLPLFVGAMTAVLFVFIFVGCTPDAPLDSTRQMELKKTDSACDSTKNEDLDMSFGFDEEYDDTITIGL